jgi:hypothetical protein
MPYPEASGSKSVPSTGIKENAAPNDEAGLIHEERASRERI